MSEQDDRLLRIEQSIINKIEQKANKINSKINPKMNNLSKNDIEDRIRQNQQRKHYEQTNDNLNHRRQQHNRPPRNHIVRSRRPRVRNWKETQKEKDERLMKKLGIDKYQLYELRKNKYRNVFKTHLGIYMGVNGGIIALLMTAMITSGSFGPFMFLMFYILTVGTGWGIGLLAHYKAGYKGKVDKLNTIYAKELGMQDKNLISSGRRYKAGNEEISESEINQLGEPYSSYIRETNVISSSLMGELKNSKHVDKQITEQIMSSLKHYTEKVYYLSKRGQLLEQAIAYFDDNNIDEHTASIEELMKDETLDSGARAEYENALRMLSKQTESYKKLISVKETIQAKLKTSLITLKTLQLDFIRLQYITEESAEDAINNLNKKTEEIDEYIDLLSDSLKDIDEQI